MHLTDILHTLGSQANAEWQKCVKEEVDRSKPGEHALPVLAEYPLMLNPLHGIQQWARMDGSLEPTTKYQLQMRYQAAAVMELCLNWKLAGLVNQYPSASLGQLVPRSREHPGALGLRRAP